MVIAEDIKRLIKEVIDCNVRLSSKVNDFARKNRLYYAVLVLKTLLMYIELMEEEEKGIRPEYEMREYPKAVCCFCAMWDAEYGCTYPPCEINDEAGVEDGAAFSAAGSRGTGRAVEDVGFHCGGRRPEM